MKPHRVRYHKMPVSLWQFKSSAIQIVLFILYILCLIEFSFTSPTCTPKLTDSSCNVTDCSMAPRSSEEYKFHCTIGNTAKCKYYEKKMNPRSTLPVSPHGYVRLLWIDIYPRSLDGLVFNALNFSFSLPFAHEIALKTEAVLVKFTSHHESYFKRCPICRVFQFQGTNFTEFNIRHPRKLQYPCFYGFLDSVKVREVYFLNFTVYPTQAVISYTLVVHGPVWTSKIWQSALATAVPEDQRDIWVVVEHPPTELKITVQKVNVTLLRVIQGNETVHRYSLLNLSENKFVHEFADLPFGTYKIKIRPICNKCEDTESELITFSPPPETPPTEPPSPLKEPLAIVTGCLIAILVILLFISWMKKYKIADTHRPCVVFLYSGKFQELINSLMQLCNNVLKLDVDSSRNNCQHKLEKAHIICTFCSGGPSNADEISDDKSEIETLLGEYDTYIQALIYVDRSPSLLGKIMFACLSNCPDNHSHFAMQHTQLGTLNNGIVRLRNISKKVKEKCINLSLRDFETCFDKFFSELLHKCKFLTPVDLPNNYKDTQEWSDLLDAVQQIQNKEIYGQTDPESDSNADSDNSSASSVVSYRTYNSEDEGCSEAESDKPEDTDNADCYSTSNGSMPNSDLNEGEIVHNEWHQMNETCPQMHPCANTLAPDMNFGRRPAHTGILEQRYCQHPIYQLRQNVPHHHPCSATFRSPEHILGFRDPNLSQCHVHSCAPGNIEVMCSSSQDHHSPYFPMSAYNNHSQCCNNNTHFRGSHHLGHLHLQQCQHGHIDASRYPNQNCRFHSSHVHEDNIRTMGNNLSGQSLPKNFHNGHVLNNSHFLGNHQQLEPPRRHNENCCSFTHPTENLAHQGHHRPVIRHGVSRGSERKPVPHLNIPVGQLDEEELIMHQQTASKAYHHGNLSFCEGENYEMNHLLRSATQTGSDCDGDLESDA